MSTREHLDVIRCSKPILQLKSSAFSIDYSHCVCPLHSICLMLVCPKADNGSFTKVKMKTFVSDSKVKFVKQVEVFVNGVQQTVINGNYFEHYEFKLNYSTVHNEMTSELNAFDSDSFSCLRNSLELAFFRFQVGFDPGSKCSTKTASNYLEVQQIDDSLPSKCIFNRRFFECFWKAFRIFNGFHNFTWAPWTASVLL